MNIGRRIFYDTMTGNVLVNTGERKGFVIETTVEQDIEAYLLTELNREKFSYIELEYGQYAQDFAECDGYRVNPETRKVEFTYPDPNKPEVEQPYQIPLSEQVAELQQAQQETNATLLEFMEASILA